MSRAVSAAQPMLRAARYNRRPCWSTMARSMSGSRRRRRAMESGSRGGSAFIIGRPGTPRTGLADDRVQLVIEFLDETPAGDERPERLGRDRYDAHAGARTDNPFRHFGLLLERQQRHVVQNPDAARDFRHLQIRCDDADRDRWRNLLDQVRDDALQL